MQQISYWEQQLVYYIKGYFVRNGYSKDYRIICERLNTLPEYLITKKLMYRMFTDLKMHLLDAGYLKGDITNDVDSIVAAVKEQINIAEEPILDEVFKSIVDKRAYAQKIV